MIRKSRCGQGLENIFSSSTGLALLLRSNNGHVAAPSLDGSLPYMFKFSGKYENFKNIIF